MVMVSAHGHQNGLPWHFLYLSPLPQGQGSLGPTFLRLGMEAGLNLLSPLVFRLSTSTAAGISGIPAGESPGSPGAAFCAGALPEVSFCAGAALWAGSLCAGCCAGASLCAGC